MAGWILNYSDGGRRMLGLLLSAIVVAWIVYMLALKYKPQGVLFSAGVILMLCTVVFGLGPILQAKQATGFILFDIFESIKLLFSDRLAGLGLTIMSIGGYVRYMEHCGANQALVEVSTAPLKLLRSPLAVLMLGYVIGEVLNIFVPSHAGLALLLMLTMYPILRQAGISKLTACAVIATAKFTDIGPVSSNAVLAAHSAGLDPTIYFIKYQFPVIWPAVVAVGITHYFIQPWYDKRDALTGKMESTVAEAPPEGAAKEKAPLIYAVLPTLPLILVVAFCPLFITAIKVDAITAMLICTVVTMICEYVNYRKIRPVLENVMTYFEGMGKTFAMVVSLVICAETFGLGLMKIGTVDTLVAIAQTSGFGLGLMVFVLSVIMIISAFLMGSGNAAFFAFASIAPKVTAHLNVAPVLILLPMELTSGMGRCMSPIAAAIVAIATIAGVSPFQVVKRCLIPVAVAIVFNMVATYMIFL